MTTEKAKVQSSKKQKSQKSDKSAAIQERLLKGEEVVKEAYIHQGIYWKSLGLFIFSILLFLLVRELGILLAVVSGLMAFFAHVKKSILMLVVTNKRILCRYGMLQVDVVDIHFDKIESVELERMIPGYVMGYSNVVIMGTGNRYIVIPYVGNGIEIRRAYNELVLEEEKEEKEE